MKNKKLLASCVGVTMGLLLTGHVMAEPAGQKDCQGGDYCPSFHIKNKSDYNLAISFFEKKTGTCMTNKDDVKVHTIGSGGGAVNLKMNPEKYNGLCIGDGSMTKIEPRCPKGAFAIVATGQQYEIVGEDGMKNKQCLVDGEKVQIINAS